MSLSVNLPDDLAARLVAEAALRGVSVDTVVAEAVTACLPESAERSGPRRLAFAGIGASGGGRGAREADELLAEGFGQD